MRAPSAFRNKRTALLTRAMRHRIRYAIKSSLYKKRCAQKVSLLFVPLTPIGIGDTIIAGSSMNLRKGTFRLWLVLSVLFVIGVDGVEYGSIHDEFRNAYTDWDAVASKYGGSTLVPVDCTKAIGKIETDYTRRDDGLCWYDMVKFRPLYPEYKNLSDKELSKRLYDKAGQPLTEFHPWIKLGKVVAFALAVPLFVLGIGSSLFWALAGFKSKQA
jgi:hypothetical protein